MLKILYIAPENTVGTLSTWKKFHESRGNKCDFITFYKTPNEFDSGICLNLPLISSDKFYRNLRSLYYNNFKTSKNEYSVKSGYPPTWEANSSFEKLFFRVRDFVWSFKVEKALQNLKLFDYDIYHFEWGLDFYRDANFAIRLKKLEKKIICTYHGQDMRTRGVIKNIDNISDLNFSSELDLLSKHPKLKYMFLPISISSELSYKKTGKKIKICHSPTDRYYKGSNHIIEVCKRLEKDSPYVEFKLIENMSHHEVIKIKKTCDILIDQIGDSGGWGYGMNSVESMKLGLCCMSEMNAACNKFFEDHPFVNINKYNLESRLRKLIDNPFLIDQHKQKSIDWVKKKHSVESVGKHLYENYNRILSGA
tara:strand:- start:793 stop:1887 length:1095 start_codon:yes stop_codon:yes gene_type:complete